MNQNDLHKKAKQIASQYHQCEQQLVAIIAKIDPSKAFYKLGYNSLFSYMTQYLKLSEATACNISAVVRKSQQVPQLKEKVISGELSSSKARKITPVINKENQNKWFLTAQNKSQKQIEREVALAQPKAAIVEKTKYIPAEEDVKEKVEIKRHIPRLKLELGVSEKLMLKIRRCQDLESQKQKRNIDIENCLQALVEAYLERKDPLRKAQRQQARRNLSPSIEEKEKSRKTENKAQELKNDSNPTGNKDHLAKNNARASVSDRFYSKNNCSKEKTTDRRPIPAHIKHQVYLRDNARCTFEDSDGIRCKSKRYLEMHHQIPVSKGGENTLGNLKLLCHGHHKFMHSII